MNYVRFIYFIIFRTHLSNVFRARDYKEILSMSRCSTHDSVLQFNPKIENSEVVTINKLESVFCAQFEFRTQTEVNKSQTQRMGTINISEFKNHAQFEHGLGNSKFASYLTQPPTPK